MPGSGGGGAVPDSEKFSDPRTARRIYVAF